MKKRLWQTDTTPEQQQQVIEAVKAQEAARLTNHTPESALVWLANLCKALDQRGVDYRHITFTDAAIAIEQHERRRKRKD